MFTAHITPLKLHSRLMFITDVSLRNHECLQSTMCVIKNGTEMKSCDLITPLDLLLINGFQKNWTHVTLTCLLCH